MISVVVPFYKDYPYLRQAVHSVLSQGLRDYEVVIVNDNPAPEAVRFLETQRFPDTVRIIHHLENKGLSTARNTGVDNANGEHIVYLDADDYFIPGGLKAQYSRAVQSQADMTHSTTLIRFEQVANGAGDLQLVPRDSQMFNLDRELVTVEEMPELQFIISSWKSIYRRDFLDREKIRFDDAQRKFEDRLYVLETVFSGAKITLCSTPSRIWRRRPGSITTSEKSNSDLLMMATLIDKCTALIERKVSAGDYDPAFLQREVYHSAARLTWDTPLLDKAADTDETALEIRTLLTRSLARAPSTPKVFDDPVVRQIDRTGLSNPSGKNVSRKEFLAAWDAIRFDNWGKVVRTPDNPDFESEKSKSTETVAGKKRSLRGARFNDVELILHVGMHKTGTTHLQREFNRNRQAMLAKGVLFPETGFIDDHSFNARADATPGHQGILRAIIEKNEEVLGELEKEVIESGCDHVLVSCENLSFPYQNQNLRRQNIKAADAFFERFPNRKVVSAIRRPDAYLEALYRERLSNGLIREVRSASEFMASNMNDLLDLERILAPWKEFADGNLVLLNYEALKLGANYTSSFCESLNLGLSEVFPNLPEENRRTYTTVSREEIELSRLLNLFIEDDVWRRAAIQGFLSTSAALNQDRPQSMLSPDERIEMVKLMQSQSEAFMQMHGLALDFEDYIAELEAETETWCAPKQVDFEDLQAMFNAAISSQSLASNADTSIREAVMRKVLKSFPRERLLKIYYRLPVWAQRNVRGIYGRLR